MFSCPVFSWNDNSVSVSAGFSGHSARGVHSRLTCRSSPVFEPLICLFSQRSTASSPQHRPVLQHRRVSKHRPVLQHRPSISARGTGLSETNQPAEQRPQCFLPGQAATGHGAFMTAATTGSGPPVARFQRPKRTVNVETLKKQGLRVTDSKPADGSGPDPSRPGKARDGIDRRQELVSRSKPVVQRVAPVEEGR